MVPRTLLRSFLALWMVTGLVLFVASVVTVVHAWPGSPHANVHAVLVGGVEAVGALLFMIPRTSRIGAVALIAAISAAFVLHTALGEFRGDLLVYLATVVFVVVHGPLSEGQLHMAFSRSVE